MRLSTKVFQNQICVVVLQSLRCRSSKADTTIMEFKEFYKKPSTEFDLTAQIAHHVQQNFNKFIGEYYYMHLGQLTSGKAQIDEVQDLKRVDDAWSFVYVEREHTACILVRSNEKSITILLCGEKEWAEYSVTEGMAALVDGPIVSPLPGFRTCPLTAMQRLEAFGFIADSLQETKNKKTG
ncbi:MAG: hypothetical protein KDD38_06510 [Bdellovibrionales bacterium]|nr:hypothetical protein [Bdellovibrionales bacterium]